MSLKDDILERVPDLGREVVKVKAWKRDVLVRGITAAEQFELREHAGESPAEDAGTKEKLMYKARLEACAVIICVRDLESKRTFEWDDLDWLMEQPKICERLSNKALELSSMGEGAFEDAVKN